MMSSSSGDGVGIANRGGVLLDDDCWDSDALVVSRGCWIYIEPIEPIELIDRVDDVTGSE